MNWRKGLLIFLAMAALSGCATVPSGPSVMVLPGPGKPFAAFQAEDISCRQWAKQQVGGEPSETVNQNLAGGAALGTVLGAGMGAALGSISGDAGAGAAFGAATGLLAGTAMASGPAYSSGDILQRRYDNAYLQCMYAYGNQIPGVVRSSRRAVPPPPPPPPPPSTMGSPPSSPPSASGPEQKVTVTAEQLEVRSGPGLNHSLVAQVPKGIVLVIRGSAPEWWYVQLPNGSFGWVMRKFTAPVPLPASG
jgi:hypothetical protein